LTKSALDLGKSTEWSAIQVTGLQIELAKLGFDESQIKNMQAPILSFATAMGAELPEAAELAGSALRAFGLDSTETERVVGVMAVGANKSALSFEFLQTAMSTIAPVAKAFDFSIEDTTALLGTLSNSGFDASTAATATRNILLNLADSNGKLAKSLGQPVKSLDDLVDGLKTLRDRGIDLNETLELTDKRSVAAFNTFLDGADSLNNLRGELGEVDGELKRIADERLNTVEGQTKLLTSAWKGLTLSFRESTGVMKDVIYFLTGVLAGLTNVVNGPKWKNLGIDDALAGRKKDLQNWYDSYISMGMSVEDAEKKSVINRMMTARFWINWIG
jgi:TP901 family phage tail tape measure protein